MPRFSVKVPITVWLSVVVEAEDADSASEAVGDITDHIYIDIQGGLSSKSDARLFFAGDDAAEWGEVVVDEVNHA